MNILLTNDDGVDSPGIHVLREVLSEKHDIVIVAPDGDRSGSSMSLNLKGGLQLKKKSPGVYACTGSPVDCVLYSLRGALDFKADIVISGINVGPNLGTDILYSGTAAAARQGTLLGIPSLALSLDLDKGEPDFSFAARFTADNLDSLLSFWNSRNIININFPAKTSGDTTLVVSDLSHRGYENELIPFAVPRGDTWYFLHGKPISNGLYKGTDWEAVASGHISLSPVAVYPETSSLEHFRKLSDTINWR